MKVIELVCEAAAHLADFSVTDAGEAAKAFRAIIGSQDKERFAIMMLDARNIPIGLHVVSVGSLTASVVHPREVFRLAIEKGAVAIVLCHNHPSGDPRPSEPDISITRTLVKCGEILGIHVLDHIIIAGDKTFSLREAGTVSFKSSSRVDGLLHAL